MQLTRRQFVMYIAHVDKEKINEFNKTIDDRKFAASLRGAKYNGQKIKVAYKASIDNETQKEIEDIAKQRYLESIKE